MRKLGGIMKRKSAVLMALLVVLITASAGCKKSSMGDVAESDQGVQTTPFNGTVAVFEGFEKIVEANRDDPAEGVEACRKYAEENIPKIKSLDEGMKGLKGSPDYLRNMVEANRKIKEINDRITKTVTDYYGVDGVDILMHLSDMALARL